jgi:HAD superfamily hydrolase (TIGR01509 family)
MTTEAILWDNDGVLIDTEGLYFQATRDALRRGGVELSRDLYIEYSLQRGRSCFDLLAARGWTPSQVAELREQRNREYSSLLAEGLQPMAGITDTLKALRERFRMAIVTTCRREHFELMHRDTNLLPFFEFAVTREDYQRSKPDPEPYLAAIKRIELRAAQCLAIEDSARGLASAHAAGVRCIVVSTELTRRSDFSNATKVLPDLSGLLEAISGLD